MTIACTVISDRADLYLSETLADLKWAIPSDITVHVVDDREHRMGMAGAVRQAWKWALDYGADYLLHWEEDFRPLDPVHVDRLEYILDRCPHLAQVVLKRQSWNADEIAAGGIIEQHPGDYLECSAFGRSITWTEHNRIFSLNPCLIPRRVLELGWPDDNEAGFTKRCLEAGYRFAFYGPKLAPPAVEHIGYVRGDGWRL